MRFVVGVISGDLLPLDALKSETDGFFVLSLEIIPRFGIPIVVIQTGGFLHGGAIELMHDWVIPKAVICGV